MTEDNGTSDRGNPPGKKITRKEFIASAALTGSEDRKAGQDGGDNGGRNLFARGVKDHPTMMSTCPAAASAVIYDSTPVNPERMGPNAARPPP